MNISCSNMQMYSVITRGRGGGRGVRLGAIQICIVIESGFRDEWWGVSVTKLINGFFCGTSMLSHVLLSKCLYKPMVLQKQWKYQVYHNDMGTTSYRSNLMSVPIMKHPKTKNISSCCFQCMLVTFYWIFYIQSCTIPKMLATFKNLWGSVASSPLFIVNYFISFH